MSQTQTWDPQRYARNAGYVPKLGQPVVELLAPQPGERILDLGCGDGVLTETLVALGCQVVGVDASPRQIAAAQKRGLNVLLMDAQNLTFDNEFDAVFSNAALHWIKGADEVIGGVWRALKPGGRFVGEFGGQGNVAKIRNALHAALTRRGVDPWAADPWYFPTPQEYSQLLEAQGFTVNFIKLIPRPTPLPTDITGWLDTFGESFTRRLPATERAAFVAEVRDALKPHLCDSQGRWTADYVRLRFAAAKPK